MGQSLWGGKGSDVTEDACTTLEVFSDHPT